MTKIDDLRAVLSMVSTNGIVSLISAFQLNLVISGCFTDNKGKGCLFYWLSERGIVNRQDRNRWIARTGGLIADFADRVKRIVVAWDAENLMPIYKSTSEEDDYPTATYTLSKSEVLFELKRMLKIREEVNSASQPINQLS